MKIITLDYETFWSQTHSLSKMTAPEYVMHPDTELQSLAVKHGSDAPFILFGAEDIQTWADDTDFSDTLLLGHNMSGFDCMIAAWRNGINPKAWGCTLAMAKPIHAKVAGGSLRALSEHYGLKAKGFLEHVNTKGKRLEEFTPEEIEKMREYNGDDVDICYDLFCKLIPQTNLRELKIIDATIRMTTEIHFKLDMPLLHETLEKERRRKREVLVAIGEIIDPERLYTDDDGGVEVTRKELGSAAKFGAVLRKLGADVPMKPSPSNPDKMIPALAKTDEGMHELLEHDNDWVAAAAQARLDVKSTLLETRLQRFITIGELFDGMMPIFLNYCGAHTTWRWSGAQKLNQQNLPRINPKNPQLTDALRKCLTAPPGKKVVSVDLSGIELRVNHFLWRVPSSVKLYQADQHDADLYIEFAAKHMYHIPEDEVTDEQRFVGKVAHLSLGFGAGAKTFRAFAKGYGKVYTLEESQEIVDTWRKAYPQIVQGWTKCHGALSEIKRGNSGAQIDKWGFCTPCKGGIKTPMALIRYPELRQELFEGEDGSKRREWVYNNRRKRPRIYGGKLCENLVQHLAREVLADMWLDYLETDIGKIYPVAHTVHDELIFVCDEDDAEELLGTVEGIMAAGVDWWPELMTSGKGAIGDNYGEVH